MGVLTCTSRLPGQTCVRCRRDPRAPEAPPSAAAPPLACPAVLSPLHPCPSWSVHSCFSPRHPPLLPVHRTCGASARSRQVRTPHLPHRPVDPMALPLCGCAQLGQLYVECGDLSPQEEEVLGPPRACAPDLRARGLSLLRRARRVQPATPPASPHRLSRILCGEHTHITCGSAAPFPRGSSSQKVQIPCSRGQCSLPHLADLGRGSHPAPAPTWDSPSLVSPPGWEVLGDPQQPPHSQHEGGRGGQVSPLPPAPGQQLSLSGVPNTSRDTEASTTQSAWRDSGEAAR